MGRIFAPFSLYLYLRDNSDGVETALAQWWRGFAADLTHKKKNPRMLSVEFNKKTGVFHGSFSAFLREGY